MAKWLPVLTWLVFDSLVEPIAVSAGAYSGLLMYHTTDRELSGWIFGSIVALIVYTIGPALLRPNNQR